MADLFDTAQGDPITLDEYIAHLQVLREEHGGKVLVQKYSAGARRQAPRPQVAFTTYRDLGGKKPLHLPQFWQEGYDPESAKGALVIRI